MCLYIKRDQKSKICRRNIKSYKVCVLCNGALNTFYQEVPIVIGETYISAIEGGESLWSSKSIAIGVALHSFISLRKLLEAINIDRDDVRVVECIIPKGSEYYLGEFESKNDAYASNQLTYVRIVDIETILKARKK